MAFSCISKSVSTLARWSALTLLLVAGCSTKEEVQPKDEPRVYYFQTRKSAPQPVYGRLRVVRPPQPLPPRHVRATAAPKIYPVLHLEVKKATLEETAKVLADSYRYSYYCASFLRKKTISINQLGTLDELAQLIEEKAEISVVVDHNNREVRFLRGKTGPDGETLP